MKKPLNITLVVIALALIFFVVNPFGVFAATSAANPQATSQTAANPAGENRSDTSSSSEDASDTEATAHSEDAGVVGLFGLNWKLFVAQLINFAIVLFVLWKFVFKPVTNNMQARAKKIEDSLVNADRITQEKADFENWKNDEMAKARTQATAIITEAKHTAEKVKMDTLQSSKLEQQQILDKAKKELAAAQQQAISEAKASIAEMVVSSTEKLLRAKLDTKTDSKIIKDSMAGIEDKV